MSQSSSTRMTFQFTMNRVPSNSIYLSKMATKRTMSDDEEDSFGPMPASADSSDIKVSGAGIQKRLKKLPFEEVYIENLPSATHYERSFMHRDIVSHIAVSKQTEFIVTGSVDGHVKFWKKMPTNLEFVKHFQAHLGAIVSFEMSPDGQKLVTCGEDHMIKFFEIQSFDMSNMILTSYFPSAACWLPAHQGGIFSKVAIADKSCGTIRIYSSEGNQAPLNELQLHAAPVRCMAFSVAANVIVSCDAKGLIEYWDAEQFTAPTPATTTSVSFHYKSETDLYALAKAKTTPFTIIMSRTGDKFLITSSDRQLRLFDFKTGKLKKIYDESIGAYQRDVGLCGGLDSLELGQRIAGENELEALSNSISSNSGHEAHAASNKVPSLTTCKPSFDETGNFLVYSSLVGIKVLNLVSNKVVRIIGSGETGERFLTTALYQGVPVVDSQFLLSKSSGGGGGRGGEIKTADQLHTTPLADPTVYCTSFKRRRFYCFSGREPDESNEARDVLNELPSEEERLAGKGLNDDLNSMSRLAKEAVVSTTLGDITIKLFGQECPRTIENFVTHSKNGYYNNTIFHRVIKGFMLQCGDPLGDGTGGESIWGGEFEDEFVRSLRHDRPYTVSMANSGPNTNGSQFFITTVPTPWLDNKHTVFGRVTAGFDVVTAIENLKCSKADRPIETTVKIMSIAVK